MNSLFRKRRVSAVIVSTLVIIILGAAQQIAANKANAPAISDKQPAQEVASSTTKIDGPKAGSAEVALETLAVKGRAPKTGYERSQFGNGWKSVSGCDMRNRILARDLQDISFSGDSSCLIGSGTLNDPYTGSVINFQRGNKTSNDVQIDHVVALSDAWQKGAQNLTAEERETLANDPLELLAVDGSTNQAKSDGDAATWLPPHKPFRCQYVARQIAVKQKYRLWVTQAEKNAMKKTLSSCPGQLLPTP